VVAHALGAQYPFDDDEKAHQDFLYLQKLMGFYW
jgi:hypothetical protein